MGKVTKSKFGTIIIIVVTLILAGVAIFTAIRLYQLGQQPVAPNVPSSQPKAVECTNNNECPAGQNCVGGGCQLQNITTKTTCDLSFALTTSATATPTAPPEVTAAPTVTATPIAPPGAPNACGGTCGSNINCGSGLYCNTTVGLCRNPACPNQTDCNCPGSTNAPTPTSTSVAAAAPSLPSSGTDWPSIVGISIGILTILGSLILAL